MLIAECKNKDIVNAEFERREILVAFHDVDGTHSLIRASVSKILITIMWTFLRNSGISSRTSCAKQTANDSYPRRSRERRG